MKITLRLCAILFLAATTFFACKKSNNNAAPVATPWGHLAVGNYWIYNEYTLDSNFQVIGSSTQNDTTFIDKDTLINGVTYYRYLPYGHLSSPVIYEYLHEEGTRITNNYGDVLFDAADFTDTFSKGAWVDTYHIYCPYDTISTYACKMTDNGVSMTVPAGTFTESAATYFHTMNSYFGTVGPLHRKLSTCYAKNVGIISDMQYMFPNASTYLQLRLVAYKH